MPTRPNKLLAGQSERERALADRTTQLRKAPSGKLAKLELSPEEGYLASRVDRPMSVSDLLLVSGLSEAQAMQLLLNLLTKGALTLPGQGEPVEATPAGQRAPYEDFAFNPRELNEDIDLDPERKKLILFLYNRLDSISHYRLLGISPNATEAEIRSAFLEKSRLFHPDTYFRKRLGSYVDKIDAIFQRVKEAHDTLMDPVQRRKYEHGARRVFTPEEVSALVQREIDTLEDERRSKSRRDHLLRSKGFAKLTKARDLVNKGDSALAQGHIKDAIQSYQSALEMDPRLDDARARLAEARKVAVAQRADLAIVEASRAEDEGKTGRALELLKSAQEMDSTNPRVYAALASHLLRNGGDLREARAHAQRAITLGDKSSKARLLNGEILLKLGLKKAARVELEAALALGETGRAETLLKEC